MDKSPDAFKTISEVAEDIDLPQHVLRFWETRFTQIKPLKRGGGRRYYRPDDIDLLRGIRHFLYGEGYTIKGLQRILKEEGIPFVQAVGRGEIIPSPAPQPPSADNLPEAFATQEPHSSEPVAAFSAGLASTSSVGQGNLFEVAAPVAPVRELSAGRIKLLKAVLEDLKECERVLNRLKLPG
ncbi:MerR family transcriptional regulator [Microvirga sp. W0021]|uniref:MerR family transcriptional regulator n=1 Tax=Hohaiivirga grylli TaxID=3133970 RepID=A0ABV0BM94_9HYPH